uniref:HSP70-like protein n=1 Tax=Grapevine leafroll-associated virus 1 TaxID=47985 RepID=A0A4D6EAM8_9CLOS|nr:HSP70-like protein [Grapevine leafroll-associated virus 1]
MEVGLDFGTTFSTACFSVPSQDESGCVSLVNSPFVPTQIFIGSDMTYSIGHRAYSDFVAGKPGGFYINPKRWVGVDSYNFQAVKRKLKPEYEVKLSDGEIVLGSVGNVNAPLVRVVDLVYLFVKGILLETEEAVGKAVSGVVCTVPAEYNSYKRSFLGVALEGLGKPLRALINEPTSAALYGAVRGGAQKETYAVFDFGGGTLDISFISRFNNVVSVLFSKGDNFLGGRDIDRAIVQFLRKEKRITGEIDAGILAVMIADLKEKICVNGGTQYTQMKTSNGLETLSMSVDELNTVSEPFIDRAIKIFVEGADELKRCPIVCVLTGGSVALPLVRQKLMNLPYVSRTAYDTKTFRLSVAVGAKIYSDILTGQSDLRLIDTVSQTLSDELSGFSEIVIFPKGHPIPSEYETTFSISGSTMAYGIVEGESNRTWLNEIAFKGTDYRPSNERKNDKVKYEISVDGKLKLSVDGRQLKNTRLPAPVSASAHAYRYVSSMKKYLVQLENNYVDMFSELHGDKISIDDVYNDTGAYFDKNILVNFLKLSK